MTNDDKLLAKDSIVGLNNLNNNFGNNLAFMIEEEKMSVDSLSVVSNDSTASRSDR